MFLWGPRNLNFQVPEKTLMYVMQVSDLRNMEQLGEPLTRKEKAILIDLIFTSLLL